MNTPLASMTVILLLTPAAFVHAQTADADNEQQQVAAALRLTQDAAAMYEVSLAKSGAVCDLKPEPILRWSNPQVGQIYGNVFVWTLQGRPHAIGSLYKWYAPHTHMSHEFHSLSTVAISAKYAGTAVWNVEKPGVAFTDVPGAPKVSATRSLRLFEMRQLARRFTAESIDKMEQIHELRLLTQPVYRYEEIRENSGIVDGGLFSFVQGTDPEVWLMLEVQQLQGTQSLKWRFALARMNTIPLKVAYEGEEVWSCETVPQREISSHREPYTKYQFD